MPSFDIIKKSNPELSFRVSSVIGKFDLQNKEIIEHFKGNIELPNNWSVGLIVGKSGTGKTTIAKQLFENAYITDYKYNSQTILDDMPDDATISEITKTFNSVGFSSPPSWLKPYNVLSNGEKMRVDLAMAILSDKDLIVFDEFTSVVDRNVAKIGSFAMQKAIRKSKKQFIGVTCHYDVEDWLIPDWTFNTDTMTFQLNEKQKKNRPDIGFKIYEAKNKSLWRMFAKYHYLDHKHNNAAHCYIATINDELAGWISILHQPHPISTNLKKVHRLVILPDYQGAGFGIKFLNAIGKIYKPKYRYTITTSAPSLIYALKKSDEWICKRYGRNKPQPNNLKKGGVGIISSANRITASFEMK